MITYRPTPETFNGERQSGKWQVYGKSRDAWISIGAPSAREDAEALVVTLRAEGRLGEPHSVPL